MIVAAFLAGVVRVHGGDPTGPFLVASEWVGPAQPWPFVVRAAGSVEGYDGQFVLVLAVDPFLKTPLIAVLDDAPYRARRITWSLAAWVLSIGRPSCIPLLLPALLAIAVGAGGAAVARWAAARSASSAWGLLFALNLGTLVCAWRMVGDAVMVSVLLAAIVLSRDGPPRWRGVGALLFAFATLQKETALAGLATLWDSRKRGIGARASPLLGLAIVLGWWSYVNLAAPISAGTPIAVNFDFPARGWLEAVEESIRSAKPALAIAKDGVFLTLYGGAILLGWVVFAAEVAAAKRGKRVDGLAVSMLLFSLMGLLLSRNVWVEVWAYSRVLLPLLAVELLYGLDRERDGKRGRLRTAALAISFLAAVSGVIFTAKNLLLATP